MQIEQSTLKTSVSGICTVEDGVIYEVNNLYGQKTRIGVTDATYNELKNISDKYYDKLVELGAIVPPKTPEEIQAETMQVMSGLLEQVKAMKQELEGLKNERKSICPDVGHESGEQPKVAERMERGSKAAATTGAGAPQAISFNTLIPVKKPFLPCMAGRTLSLVYTGTAGTMNFMNVIVTKLR